MRNLSYLLPAIVNSVAVVFGSSIGFLFRKGISERFRRVLFAAVGLSTIGIGLKMILGANNFLIVLFSMVVGGVIGEFFDLEGKLKAIGDNIKEGDFSTGFVTSSLLFLVGPMTIVGSITAGLNGDGNIIYTKSLLDFISSIVLSSTYGLGVMLSALSVLVIQGGITLFASLLTFLTSPVYLNDLVAVGGLMVFGIGLRILEIKDPKVGNYLPALLVSPVLTFLTSFLK
ncbi:hypothetical protein SAMN04488510_10874 [Fervidobacterium changbaicum]|uniref:DUF554 domain-containing protein n=1 Tax=Fervidobacterium islandicum TaxID=2423 RepID=A0AAI8CL24_FERIS|nr:MULTISPECIES: DUF554 domain-containing protein [Fervidobacterium]AMW32346.1 DUF554 domain-containing protein [Fervidobacterium islandicum]SDH23100.1 hypothetical protein SAMN04488510_10874 [Fervidobacterium changbaicum]